ncbi:hypothetical protein B0J13DRAFT_458495, partial [Dactylonectria estremocensis]
NVQLIDPKRDALYNYDAEAQKAIANAKPWAKDANYFKHVRISAVALIKMTMHARSGGNLEVMGLMQGYIDEDTFIVTDAFRLPVVGWYHSHPGYGCWLRVCDTDINCFHSCRPSDGSLVETSVYVAFAVIFVPVSTICRQF